MKTKFNSYCLNGLPKGCKYCVKGEKSVLFLGGKCSRSCWYCSLSDSRKACQRIFLNERPINTNKDFFEELKKSNSRGIGITGGDPFVNLDKNLKIIKTIRKKMGKNFHMHIYLPINLVNEKKVKILNKYVDEIRFHPSFLVNPSEGLIYKEIEKIKTSSRIFKKKNTGIEMPIIPDKKNELYEFIKKISPFVGFVNLNEFELSETNFDRVTKDYSLNEDSYSVFGSLKAGKWIINKARKDNLKIKIHLCSAKTKDFHQYKNRLRRYDILPFGNRLKNGNVVYFTTYDLSIKNLKRIKKITNNCCLDKERKRVLIKMGDVLKVYEALGLKIAKIEEQPVFGNERVSFELVGKD